ncbi:MAG: FtsQ-type POTRA domain-containing protein [bacterium]|nr:FtsQ-type POTRA domain-containing protein [bacterium]
MKSIYTHIKINNEHLKKKKRKVQKDIPPHYIWKKVLHGVLTGLLMLIVILVGIQLTMFVFWSNYFSLRKVEISTTKQINRTEILNLADVQLQKNLVTLPTRNIIKRVMVHPWVKEVRIQKRFPATIRIDVVERSPIAVVCGKEMYGVDAEGYLLPGIYPESLQELPIVTVPENVLVEHPTRINSDGMRNVLTVITYLKENAPWFLKEISEFNITAPDNLLLYTLHEGTEIRLGKENFEERLNKLLHIWQIIKQQQLEEEYIDLRFDKQGIVTKPKIVNKKRDKGTESNKVQT